MMTEAKLDQTNNSDNTSSKTKNHHQKAVIRLDTLQVFDSARQASLAFGTNQGAVSSAIGGNYKFDGARWQLYEDYLNGVELPPQQVSSRFKGKKHSEQSEAKTSAAMKGRRALNETKIVNLTTKQVFDNMCLACESVGYNKTTMSGSFYHNKKKGRNTIRMAEQEWIRLEDVTDEIREQYNLDNL